MIKITMKKYTRYLKSIFTKIQSKTNSQNWYITAKDDLFGHGNLWPRTPQKVPRSAATMFLCVTFYTLKAKHFDS